jgi:hypothetical protein
MLLSSIIAGPEINHGKGGFGNYSSVVALGLQTVFSSFFVSILGMRRK